MAKAFRPDLIISDINMPEMNGIELAQTIREDSQLADIPCVLMSSSDWEEKALQVANYFLAKPFTLISVEQIVKSAVYRTD